MPDDEVVFALRIRCLWKEDMTIDPEVTRELLDRTDEIVFRLAHERKIPHIGNDPAAEWEPEGFKHLLKQEFSKPEYNMTAAQVVALAIHQSLRNRYFYELMDGRAANGTEAGYDRAWCYTVETTLEEAKQELRKWARDTTIWRGDTETGERLFLGRG